MRKEIKIRGMSCAHCAGAVKKELEKIGGVLSAEVDLRENKAVVELSGDTVTDEALRTAVDEAGFDVLEICV